MKLALDTFIISLLSLDYHYDFNIYFDYLKKVSNACCIVPTVNKYSITPHTETYQVFVWHMLVSHPKLQIKKTVW